MGGVMKHPAKPFVTLSGITLRAGGRLAFRNTNWTFLRGEQWAMVGPNSSGKTLLASALAGEIPVVRGEILYGFRPSGQRTAEGDVAHVSFEQHKAAVSDAPAASRWQEFEDSERVTVREFLSRERVEEINPYEIVDRPAPSAYAFARRRKRVLRLLQIDGLQDRLLPTLSNGEMRKTLLARALLRNPRLLILDDPFSGLDARFRVHLKQILENLMGDGKVRLLLICTRREDLPRGLTHLMFVDRCRVVARGRLRTMLADPRIRELHLDGGVRSVTVSVRRGRRVRAALAVGEELIRLERISVRYGRHVILKEVDWTIRRGEHWALMGPNGSGKSALLSLIIGDHPQVYANTIYVFGRQRGTGESVWELKRRIGWVSPELHLHFPETQTCLETVISGFHDSYGLYEPPARREIEQGRRCLAAFGLSACTRTPLGSLSAGLQRMILLARALVKAPELLVLDEPCQGLDFRHRRSFLRTVENLLQTTRTTVIYVTHRPDEIPEGIDRVLRLSDGRVARGRV
jgi:molybdate transport system ATP-binding protein